MIVNSQFLVPPFFFFISLRLAKFLISTQMLKHKFTIMVDVKSNSQINFCTETTTVAHPIIFLKEILSFH